MLLINGQLITGANVRFFGLPSVYQGPGANPLLGYAGMAYDQKAALPNGYGMDGFVPALKDGGMSAYYGLGGASELTAAMQLGKDLTAELVGAGAITEAGMSLIVSMLAELAGNGGLSAAMQGTIKMAATLAGAGDISAALGVIAWCAASLSGEGGLDGSNLRGTLSMAAEISSAGEIVTAASCATAVWAASDAELIKKLLANNVSRSGDIITIYEDDGTTPWRQYDLANGGRVRQ